MALNRKPPVVLTIAGFDPSGGAGVIADVKTIAAFGCYGVAAVSSLTFQNTAKLHSARSEPADSVREQVELILEDFEIAAIKTGMLQTAEVVKEVARLAKSSGVPIIVVDPVLRSTSGFYTADKAAIHELATKLIPLASLVTPNLYEAELIAGIEIKNQRDLERAGERIHGMGAKAVLLTGGDAESGSAIDLLVDQDGSSVFSATRVESENTHGTGCTFASALACLMARGYSLKEAIPIAKDYVLRAILSAPGLGRGKGPLNHFPPGFESGHVF